MANYFKEELSAAASPHDSAPQAAPQAEMQRETTPQDASERPARVRGVSEIRRAATSILRGVGVAEDTIHRIVDQFCLLLPPMPRRVYLASPFRSGTPDERDRHRLYLFDACEDATYRGEAWIAPHALYTAHLDERDPTQRDQGLRMGLAWIAPDAVDVVAVYADLGISEGMAAEIAWAEAAGIAVETRSISGWTSASCPYRPDEPEPLEDDPTPDPLAFLAPGGGR